MVTHILRVSLRNCSRRLSKALMPAIVRCRKVAMWTMPRKTNGRCNTTILRLLQKCRIVLLKALLRACPNWSSNMLTFLVPVQTHCQQSSNSNFADH